MVIIKFCDASFVLDQWCKNLGKWKVEIPSVEVSITKYNSLICNILYTLFQNGHHLSILLFTFKLALVALFSNSKFKRIFPLKRGNKGSFSSKQKNTKMVAILE